MYVTIYVGQNVCKECVIVLNKLIEKGKEIVEYLSGKYMLIAMQEGIDVKKALESNTVEDVARKTDSIREWDERKESYWEFVSDWEKQVRNDILVAAGLPGCFGEMPDSVHNKSYQKTSPYSSISYDTKYSKLSTWQSNTEKVKERGKEYIEYIKNIAKCGTCTVFDRCHKLSSTRQIAEKEYYVQ